MDVAFVSQFEEEGRQRFVSLEGDPASFGLSEGASITFEESICKRVIPEGSSSVGFVADAKSDERVADLGVVEAADVGSYVGVPLRFSDGRTYGTLCALSHATDPFLREREAGNL